MEHRMVPDALAEAAAAREEGLDTILVGGNAINLHGYLRATYDVDLLVRENEAPRWVSFFEKRGYHVVRRTANFARLHFATDPAAALPIDLMFADDRTFDRLNEKAQRYDVGNGRILQIPSALHLIAMKLHALRNPARAEKGVDFSDVKHLIRIAGIDIRGREFIEVADRYATETIRSRIEQDLAAEGS